MSQKFVFNKKENRFDVVRLTVGRIIWNVFKFVFLSLLLAIIGYAFYALVFDTPEEKELRSQNRSMEEAQAVLETRIDLLEQVVTDLQARDRELYGELFQTVPPAYRLSDEDTNRLDLAQVDRMSYADLVWNSYAGLSRMESRSRRVEMMFDSINAAVTAKGARPTGIPSIVPLKNFTITQTGASVGNKINPFYKILRRHDGIDLAATEGTQVLAVADGTVTDIQTGHRTFGNRITITHPGGIQTTYSHLSKMSISRGQQVRQGAVIGEVGSTGRAFASHLHFEVINDGQPVEPVHYFFADLDRHSYRDMLLAAMTNGQSLD